MELVIPLDLLAPSVHWKGRSKEIKWMSGREGIVLINNAVLIIVHISWSGSSLSSSSDAPLTLLLQPIPLKSLSRAVIVGEKEIKKERARSFFLLLIAGVEGKRSKRRGTR